MAYNQAAPKDASGKPQIDKFLTDDDRKLFMDALMKQCDAKDGVADGMISDPLGCDFDPAVLACKPGQSGRLHRAGKNCSHQESLRRTEECVWHAGLSGLPLRRGHHYEGPSCRVCWPWARTASSAPTPPQPKSTSTRQRCMPPIRSSSLHPPISRRSP